MLSKRVDAVSSISTKYLTGNSWGFGRLGSTPASHFFTSYVDLYNIAIVTQIHKFGDHLVGRIARKKRDGGVCSHIVQGEETG